MDQHPQYENSPWHSRRASVPGAAALTKQGGIFRAVEVFWLLTAVWVWPKIISRILISSPAIESNSLLRESLFYTSFLCEQKPVVVLGELLDLLQIHFFFQKNVYNSLLCELSVAYPDRELTTSTLAYVQWCSHQRWSQAGLIFFSLLNTGLFFLNRDSVAF